MKMRKAISPLIATILLIAFTLAIGGFISTWLHSIAKTQTEETIASAKPECVYVYLNTINATYDNETMSADLQIENTGTKSVFVIKIQIIYDNGTQVKGKWNTTKLSSNEILYINDLRVNSTGGDDEGVNESIKKIRILTDCPGKTLDIKGENIVGRVQKA